MKGKVSPRFYNKKYYYQKCEGHEEFVKGKISKRFAPAFSLLGNVKGQNVLDIGCGRGEMVIYCAKKGSMAYGIDYSKDAIEIARKNVDNIKKIEHSISDKVSFKLMEAGCLQFKDHFFDKVLLLDFIEHVYPEELENILMETKRVTKVKGMIIIHTPNLWFLRMLQTVGHPFGYKESNLHVNLQSYFQLKRSLKILNGDIKFHFIKRKNYFFHLTSNIRKSNLGNLSVRILDYLFEISLIAKVVHSNPFAFLFESDFWITINDCN